MNKANPCAELHRIASEMEADGNPLAPSIRQIADSFATLEDELRKAQIASQRQSWRWKHWLDKYMGKGEGK